MRGILSAVSNSYISVLLPTDANFLFCRDSNQLSRFRKYQRRHCTKMEVDGRVFPYSLPSVGPGANPGVQAVSPQLTWSESRHRPAITFCQACGYLRSFHQMALPVNGSTHLIPAYYSFIDPVRMKGWVGLVGWPVADGLPTLVVTHQLQVARRIGKVRQSETDVLPLCYTTNSTKMEGSHTVLGSNALQK